MASTSFSFRRSSRLVSPEQYDKTLRCRPFARTKSFTCHRCDVFCQNSAPLNVARLGLVVPKRLVQLSVRRNAIKRVLREAFRCQQWTLPPGDYVFRLKAALPASSLTELKLEVRRQADELLSKAGASR